MTREAEREAEAGGRERQRQRLEDTTLLALNMEEGATNQRIQAASRRQKTKEISSFLNSPAEYSLSTPFC